MRKLAALIVSLALILPASGCTNRIGDFTAVSSKNMDLTRGADFKRGTSRVKADDTAAIILGIPTGVPNMKNALDRAIEKTPGAVGLVDAVVSQKVFYLVLFGQTGYEVEGTPLIDPHLEKSLK
jgi:hypothetical protein